MDDFETDVLVVGAGLTGLTASLTLATHGVSALTIARHPSTAPQPRASITNQRTMEILRGLGLEERARAVAVPLSKLNHNVFATSMAGMELARYKAYGTAERFAVHGWASPCGGMNLPQHLYEPVLLEAARERGAEVRFSHELVAIEQSADAVRAVVRDLDRGEEYTVRAKYVVGADGGRSKVAQETGFTHEGQSGLRHMVNFWVNVDLTPYAAYRPSTMYIVAQPGAGFWTGSGTFVCVRPWNEWVVGREYDPTAGELDESEEGVIEYVRSLVGDPEIPVKLKNVSKWQVNNVVANEYRRGRVFLAGDAAHLHPPAGGLGGNTSIQDAFNLCWKLASVLSGEAGEGLLDTYHQERRPIGRQVVDRAILSMENMSTLVDVLGFKRGQSAEEGQKVLDDLFSDAVGSEERRVKLDAALKLADYRSNAQGFELGQRYISSAVVDDGTAFPDYERDPELYYHRTTHPGAHIPHVWVEKDRKSLSTLDVVGVGRFSLVVGVGGRPWSEAAAALRAELGVEVPVHAIGKRCEYDDVLGDWAALREITDRGALLVRPDRFIAWRSLDIPANPYEVLRDAVRQALCLDASRLVLDQNDNDGGRSRSVSASA